ncbi:endonuclease [Polaribacter vadi]|uniref:endonuclease n=1 Tax=Polaribacter TaxID=52959 RepID=UPI001C07F357|nr:MULTISPECIES: endonuclease [Polaribacter]MBU3012195.1 endonuclease [Polaribacter vadi]MDO6742011.1 endonuclease [Polaribacter sp. 1_MG-2023]
MKRLFNLLLVLSISLNTLSQENYYNDVNLNVTGLTLKEELATKIISTHTQFLFYDQVWDASKATDVNPNNSNQVLLIYGFEDGSDTDVTNDRERGINENSGSSGDWNREHVYSQSLGTPALSDSGPGSDAHHLRPADAQRNSSRNNRKFTTGSGNSGIQTDGGWYPGDEWKGDVARMMMYMYVRYNDRCLPTNIGFGDNSSTPDDMIDLFLQWNVEDPVSDFERQRNTYHENTTNQNAQGNRNPFIDNPILATRIWGGTKAEDSWGIYTSSDTEAPTAPTNLSTTNVTTFSLDLSWTAATDNTAVTSYDIYIDGNLVTATSNTSVTLSNLSSNTNYSFTVFAKDIVNNSSESSTALNVSTLADNEAPTTPTNVTISNETESTFIVSWSSSTDNTKVDFYEVYIDDLFVNSSENEMYTVTGLTPSTTFKVEILAVDEVGNKSNLSNAVSASTTNGSTVANELFFSEYIEGSSNNKALEIVNLTNADIDISIYSIKRQSNGGVNGDEWEYNLPLTGIIKSQDVYVIVNEAAGEFTSSTSETVKEAGQFLIEQADFIQIHDGDTNFGAPINFNGNDPVGLFKNDVLIDIIGTYNGGTSNFAKDKTIRRKSGVSQPNTTFDLENEWDVFAKDNAEDFGSHSAIVLSTDQFNLDGIKFYPNPANDYIRIQNNSNKVIKNLSITNVLGKKVVSEQNPSEGINIQQISKGIYILQFQVDGKIYSTKIIKK